MTDKEMSDILNDIVVIVDTREQKNEHILKYFDGQGVKYITEKLDSADYSIILPNYPQLNLDRVFLVEKKNSLDELAGNFTKGRERFVNEFERASGKIHLLVENATFKKMFNGSYRSKFPPKSYLASLLTWNIRYGSPVWFCTKEETGALIYSILYYELREHLLWTRRNEDADSTN